MRRFNVTGVCIPEEDYMVDISGKLAQIRSMVDRGDYFTINRARQYGKTTTLSLLEKQLQDEYVVASISFEGLGDNAFASDDAFCAAFLRLIHKSLSFAEVTEAHRGGWLNTDVHSFEDLSDHITAMCRPGATDTGKKLVLMVDEVDKTSNNRTYLHFLGMLRDKFLARRQNEDYTFHSVIFAGLYDVRFTRAKLTPEGIYAYPAMENTPAHAPWNIAVSFNIDMSFSPAEISTMLIDYEADHSTGMDIVVDFGADQFIIELKLWKGEAAHEKAYEQLAGYLGGKGASEGYLLTFDFRKGVQKQARAEWVDYDGKRIFDVVAVAGNS